MREKLQKEEELEMYKNLIKKLMNFQEAAYYLLEEMEKYDDELLCDGYPFNKDFHEVVLEIMDWVETSEAKLKKVAKNK
ncbi:hypothetical protein SAMN02746089_02523 [Caldanaerobius fijiensis DSM 17918]|uniref:Uncharacterized protein n=2 Tax=Caldanaerobius TaxID=862261 RepID=A0A1M5EC83_9THEO|nr:hypothetical protein SAMN02746089_02523 [Caldanaerobius fijiensis DSM 17918]